MQPQLITEDTLNEFGIDIANKNTETLLTHLNNTLEERVGTEITEALNDEQLDEFVSLQEKDDDSSLASWLEQNVPELQEIVKDEIDILLGELAENSNTLNEE